MVIMLCTYIIIYYSTLQVSCPQGRVNGQQLSKVPVRLSRTKASSLHSDIDLYTSCLLPVSAGQPTCKALYVQLQYNILRLFCLQVILVLQTSATIHLFLHVAQQLDYSTVTPPLNSLFMEKHLMSPSTILWTLDVSYSSIIINDVAQRSLLEQSMFKREGFALQYMYYHVELHTIRPRAYRLLKEKRACNCQHSLCTQQIQIDPKNSNIIRMLSIGIVQTIQLRLVTNHCLI